MADAQLPLAASAHQNEQSILAPAVAVIVESTGNPNALEERAHPLQSLSTLAKSFIFIVMAWHIYKFITEPLLALILTILWIPTIILFRYWRRYYQHAELDRVVRLFATGMHVFSICKASILGE
jgi:hypothetical protein